MFWTSGESGHARISAYSLLKWWRRSAAGQLESHKSVLHYFWNCIALQNKTLGPWVTQKNWRKLVAWQPASAPPKEG